MQNCFFLALILWTVGAFGALAFWKNNRWANLWGNSLAILGSVFGLAASIQGLIFNSSFSFKAAA